MTDPRVFQLSDVADILEVPKSTIKNWTIGRPLKIASSIRAGRGAGASNLYGISDVYLLAIAVQLSRDGFNLRVVEEAVSAARPKLGSLGKVFSRLTVSSPGRKLEVRLLSEQSHEPERASVVGKYTLDLRKMIERVEARIKEILQARIKKIRLG